MTISWEDDLIIFPAIIIAVPCYDSATQKYIGTYSFRIWEQLMPINNTMIYELYHFETLLPLTFIVNNFKSHKTILEAMVDLSLDHHVILKIAKNLDYSNYNLMPNASVRYRVYNETAVTTMSRIWFLEQFGTHLHKEVPGK